MSVPLSVLCVSKGEPKALPFLHYMERLARSVSAECVIALDGGAPISELAPTTQVVHVHSRGYIESVLDSAITMCNGEYILRLDDDEKCSPAMERWLRDGYFLLEDHWKFPRMHLWGDEHSVLMTPHLWPDWQTRLSIKEKSGGRHGVHAGSPYGGGEEAPVALVHYKFLVRSREERLRIAQQYDAFCPGYGTGNMKPFSLPEEAYSAPVELWSVNDGRVPWIPMWKRAVAL